MTMSEKGSDPPPLARGLGASFGETSPERPTAAQAGPISAVCAVLAGIAILAAWTGGLRGELFGVTISVREPWKPVAMAAVLLAARWSVTRHREPLLTTLSIVIPRVLAGALLVAGVIGWFHYLSPYAGGADSYGYVSAAGRIRSGTLIEREPLADVIPAPFSAIPLGYVPKPGTTDMSVPAYPLGLPALMAIAAWVFGERGLFLVPLASGVVLVSVCCWLVYRWTRDSTTAVMAAAAVAIHPVVFAYSIQPMSDVTATAFYLIAAALLLSPQPSLAALAGAAASVALITRTAQLPGAAALVIVPLVYGSKRIPRAAAFVTVLACGVAIQLWLQWYLYGNPLGNGYGSASELFGLRHLPANARSYAYWGYLTHGLIWIAGVVVAFITLRDITAWAIAAAAAVGAILPYAIYRTYDHWETQRFILPLLVVGTLFAIIGLITAARRLLGPRIGTWAALLLTFALAWSWARWLEHEQVLSLARAQERFAQAGQLVARVTPAKAVILASLHSGSLRYYAHRQSVDWAKIPSDQFTATVDALQKAALPVFLLLDGEEERLQFVSRHGTVVEDQRWLPSGQRRDLRLYQAPLR
jgi:hypothetical protein